MEHSFVYLSACPVIIFAAASDILEGWPHFLGPRLTCTRYRAHGPVDGRRPAHRLFQLAGDDGKLGVVQDVTQAVIPLERLNENGLILVDPQCLASLAGLAELARDVLGFGDDSRRLEQPAAVLDESCIQLRVLGLEGVRDGTKEGQIDDDLSVRQCVRLYCGGRH